MFLPRETKVHNWLEKTQNASMQRAHENEGALYFLFAMQINLPIPTNPLGLNVHGCQYFQIFGELNLQELTKRSHDLL